MVQRLRGELWPQTVGNSHQTYHTAQCTISESLSAHPTERYTWYHTTRSLSDIPQSSSNAFSVTHSHCRTTPPLPTNQVSALYCCCVTRKYMTVILSWNFNFQLFLKCRFFCKNSTQIQPQGIGCYWPNGKCSQLCFGRVFCFYLMHKCNEKWHSSCVITCSKSCCTC